MKKENTKKLIVLNAIEQSKGKFFTVEFKKRTNGENRVMTCRTGVKTGTNGTGLKFDPITKGLQVVWDCHKKSFRMITLENVTKININNLKIEFK
tara:strand:+ start:456 stop:740 length:285 start_codon:yes stop_codon:yes gene_type:complete